MASGLSGPAGLNRGVGLYEGVEGLYGGAPGLASGPFPLVSIDFKNGLYAIGGVSKALADVCTQDLNWGSYSASDVVAGVGYRRQNGAGGNGPVLTAAAYAAIGNQFVGVMRYRFGIGVAAVDWLSIQLAVANLPSYANYATLVVGKPFYGQTLIEDQVGVQLELGAAGYSDGAHIAATRFAAGQVAVSFDEGAVSTAAVASQSSANAIALWADSTGSTDSSAIIEGVDFYAVDDFTLADLPTLSGV